MTTTNNLPRVLQRGWRQRAETAKMKTLAARDPARLLAVRIRSMQGDLAQAGDIAAAEFSAAHAPVASPIPQQVHRDVAELLVGFLEQHGLAGTDLTRPLKAHETVEEIAQRHRIRIQRELDEGVRELAALERDRAVERVQAAEISLEAVDQKHAAHRIETVSDEQPAKRGRGRPPRHD